MREAITRSKVANIRAKSILSNNELVIFRGADDIFYNSKTSNLPQYNLIYKLYMLKID